MPKTANKEKFVRKNITYPADFEPQLEAMRKEFGLSSHSELIRFAINKLSEAGFPEYRRKRQEQEAVQNTTKAQDFEVAAE